MDREFVYVGDPMCSWCWGFAPVLEALRERFDLPMQIVVGGLAVGPAAREVDDEMAAFLGQHWREVEKATAQPFDHRLLDRRGWYFDTGPACAAVVAMRAQAPELTLDWFTRLQRAFYDEGVDLSDPSVYGALAEDFAPDPVQFVRDLQSETIEQQTTEDFAVAQGLGVRGFPTLFLRDGDAWVLIAQGYAPLIVLEPALRRWMEENWEPEVVGEVCRVDEAC